MKQRICIYLTYDKQNIIDDYIGYMLRELKTCADYLVVVCNEKNIAYGMDILETYADEIFLRENLGFDAGGFKDALCKYLGWDKVLAYDELVLVNDSMFGPFRSMKEIFAEMSNRIVDFWGLTKHGETRNGIVGYIPEHIQTFFLVIRYEMFHCPQFREYWEKMPYYSSFDETVKQHEMRFTKIFSEWGYTFDSLANTSVNDSINIENNYSQYAVLSYELIKKRNFPFLKKKQIVDNTLNIQTQENLRQALNYIDKETDYDVNLIWSNIIRTFNMTDLQRTLHLQYIISEAKRQVQKRRILIAVFIRYHRSAEYVLDYINDLKNDYAVKVFVKNREFAKEYQDAGFDCREIKNIQNSDQYEEFCTYDFVCVLHDTDLSSDARPNCVGKSYFYNIWENLIKCREHIESIMVLFEEEPYLGYLAAPEPNFGESFGQFGNDWDREFEIIFAIAKEMGLNCQISENEKPFCITENFWIRGCVLKKLEILSIQHTAYLKYLWTFIVQHAGYYSGIVESAEYASMNEVNLQYYLRRITQQMKEKYGCFNSFLEMEKKLISGALREFCNKYSRIFVYGAGDVARKYCDLIPEIEAFIVSDDQKKPDYPIGIPVLYLSELPVLDEVGVVLCLNKSNQMQVIPLLEEHGISKYFCI